MLHYWHFFNKHLPKGGKHLHTKKDIIAHLLENHLNVSLLSILQWL